MKVIHAAIVTVAIGGFSLLAFAADPVDLRGKKGVVDPADLKKDNPKERSLKIKEPPSSKSDSSGADAPRNPPSDEGGKPGGGAAGVRTQTPRYAPPPRPVPGR